MIFLLAKKFLWKTLVPLSHCNSMWAGLVSGSSAVCEIQAAPFVCEVPVQPGQGTVPTPYKPVLLPSLPNVASTAKLSETEKIPAPPSVRLSEEICSSVPRMLNSFTFHLDGFHGNHSIKLCSYLLQHYIICQTLSCSSTSVFVQGYCAFCFFFFSLPVQLAQLVLIWLNKEQWCKIRY